MPNDSSIALRTSTQRCNKVPIGYNGTRQINPKNCPFPLYDHHQNLIHPYRARPHSPSPTTSGSNQPFCHSAHVRTDGDDECSITILLRSVILIASDAVIMSMIKILQYSMATSNLKICSRTFYTNIIASWWHQGKSTNCRKKTHVIIYNIKTFPPETEKQTLTKVLKLMS